MKDIYQKKQEINFKKIDYAKKDLPVYYMFHDEWSTLDKISDSFEQYITILKLIDNTDLEDKEEIDELKETIEKLVPGYFEYWNDLIKVAYEFYTE